MRFHHDLRMCQKLFVVNLVPVIGKEVKNQLFLNLDELVSISAEIAEALKKKLPGWLNRHIIFFKTLLLCFGPKLV